MAVCLTCPNVGKSNTPTIFLKFHEYGIYSMLSEQLLYAAPKYCPKKITFRFWSKHYSALNQVTNQPDARLAIKIRIEATVTCRLEAQSLQKSQWNCDERTCLCYKQQCYMASTPQAFLHFTHKNQPCFHNISQMDNKVKCFVPSKPCQHTAETPPLTWVVSTHGWDSTNNLSRVHRQTKTPFYTWVVSIIAETPLQTWVVSTH